MRPGRTIAMLLGAVVVTAAVSFGVYRRYTAPRPNIIVILVDALRWDHLGCYGYGRDTSPALDRFARQGARFTEAFTQGGYTLPSLSSLFTGRWPFHHNVWASSPVKKLPDTEQTWAEFFQQRGYRTAAITGGGFASEAYGFAQGFQEFMTLSARDDAQPIVDAAISWLRRDRRAPFFLYLHTYSVHEPYNPPAEYAGRFERRRYQGPYRDALFDFALLKDINTGVCALTGEDKEFIVASYDAGIRYCDDQIGRLLQALDEMRVQDNTVVVVLADHGEDLFEHNFLGHRDVYDVGMRVPLLIRYPRRIRPGTVVRQPVRLIDVFPSLARLTRLSAPSPVDGRSFVSLLNGRQEWGVRKVLAVGSVGYSPYDRLRVAIRTPEWKCIATLAEPQGMLMPYAYELYNMQQDPAEAQNVFASEPDIAQGFQDELISLFRERTVLQAGGPPLPDQQTADRLKSLGYVQ